MSPVRLLARPLLAGAYITNGIARIRDPRSSQRSAEAVLRAAGTVVDLPVGPETLARAAGAAQVAAGSLLAIGKLPRLSASVLVGTYLFDVIGSALAPSEGRTKEEKAQHREELITRTSLLGGALLASVDTAGRPGLAWRAQHAAEDLRRSIEKTSARAIDAVTSHS
ncbi:DoxX family membrane protein [Brevibacterium album]|uniref:DoxX family membrane protein n=1 Tax=Brevibacterium album TaxID=417948 RepID=UPI00041086ED|nr:DoxX family membrane protein [Brevibacterium album]